MTTVGCIAQSDSFDALARGSWHWELLDVPITQRTLNAGSII
jgi:hypothetical protein